MKSEKQKNFPWMRIIFQSLIFGLPIWFMISMIISIVIYAIKGAHNLSFFVVSIGCFGFLIFIAYNIIQSRIIFYKEKGAK